MILVTGATGLNGGMLVARLSARGERVRALVRSKDKAADLAILPHVEVVVGDLGKPETLVEPLKGVQHAMLISTANEEMERVQNAFIDAAKKAGVEHVVKLSGVMCDPNSDFRFARMHGNIEKHLEESGLGWTHLRAGEFMQAYFRQVPNILRANKIIFPLEDARIASVDASDVVDIAELALTQPGHMGKAYYLTGLEALTMHEVAKKIGKATGRDITYENVSPEQMKAMQIKNGIPEVRAQALSELFAERRKGAESKVHHDIEGLLRRKPISFDDFAHRWAAIFNGQQPAPNL
jgi:uncharacterized protein YbjT (DUF2867 family)